MGLIDLILERLFPPAPESLADVAGSRPGRRVVVRGRLVPRDLIESPLTGERCVYYRYLVEEWRRSSVPLPVGGMADGFWAVVEQDEAIAEFYLQDESGRAIVSPEHARVEIGGGITADHLPMQLARRASELRLGAGDLIEVEGVVEAIEDQLDETRGYRESAVRLLLRAPDGGVLRIRLVSR